MSLVSFKNFNSDVKALLWKNFKFQMLKIKDTLFMTETIFITMQNFNFAEVKSNCYLKFT